MHGYSEEYIEKKVDAFMEQHGIQYSLFHSVEEVETAMRDIARQGVIAGLMQVQKQMEALNEFTRSTEIVEAAMYKKSMLLGGYPTLDIEEDSHG